MRFVLLVIASLVAVSAQANESRFVVNKNEGQADIQMKYRRLDSGYEYGNSFTNVIGLEYARALPQYAEMNVGLGFAHKDARGGRATDTTTRATALGFTDITGGLRIAEVEDSFSWYYGGVASISPGAARDRRLSTLNAQDTNNLSGFQTLGGVLGIESYVDKLALGGEFETRVYSQRSVEGDQLTADARISQHVIPTLKGFIEFPVVAELALGFNASLMRPDYRLDQMILGGPDNHLSGKLYSEWKVDKETAALIEVGSSSLVLPFRENQTEVSLGIRKAL